MTYEYSLNGKDWSAFDPGKDLAAVMGGRQGARLSTIPSHAAGERSRRSSLAARSPTLPGPNNVKVVENARLRLEVDPYGVRGIFDKNAGKVVSHAAFLHDALAMVVTKKPGASPTIATDLYNSQLETVETGGHDGDAHTHHAPTG